MSDFVTLKAADGHELNAYVARPAGEPIAGLIVVQEIFGVNAHIRSVADGYAADGFLVIAPAIFDRVERGVEIGYEGDQWNKAIALMQKLDPEKVLLDLAAAKDFVATESGKKVGVVGYCYGGTMAWLSATRLGVGAAVGYYGGGIGKYASENPTAPVMLHFGSLDTHIPAEEVAKVQAAHPEVQIFWYDAGHAFNRDVAPSYEETSAIKARERSLSFLKEHLA